MNQVPSPMCPHCGRNLSTDDLRGINCPSCGTSLPHHARAAQQVALVNQVMAQHMAAIPTYGMHHQQQVHHQVQQATRAAMSIGLIVAVIIGIVTVLVVVGAVVAVVLVRAQ